MNVLLGGMAVTMPSCRLSRKNRARVGAKFSTLTLATGDSNSITTMAHGNSC